MRKTLSSLVIALVLGWSGAVHAGIYQKGWELIEAGDYETALREFRDLAKNEDAGAQFFLGVMYKEGYGVAADFTTAHMWFNIAAASGGSEDSGADIFRDSLELELDMISFEAENYRDYLEYDMTSDDIAEAQKLAREWLHTYTLLVP